MSRYHRLGGGDIDAAVLHEVLLPQILEQNSLSEFDLDFHQKKRQIEPSFIGVAESLKIGLCKEIRRLMDFGVYATTDKTSIKKTLPGVHTCQLADKRQIRLKDPHLNAHAFEQLLAPFLDSDMLHARETEYRLTCSFFAPLQDALERAGLKKTDIDYCLLAGGSCQIPQLVEALQAYFHKNDLLLFQNQEDLQTAVARGAALHALALAKNGKGLVQPVCHDTIAIKTRNGLYPLIEKGVELPYSRSVDDLLVPETVITGNLNLRLEIVASEDGRVLASKLCSLSGPLNKGDRLHLTCQYDENQVLSLEVSLVDDEDGPAHRFEIENPLTNVVNPQTVRLKIDEREEELRTGKIPKNQHSDTFVELAEWYAELGQYEKAVDYLKMVLNKTGPDDGILNQMAMYYGATGDYDRQEKFYREAHRVSRSWGGPMFNLALAYQKRRKYAEAVEAIDAAIARDDDPPYLILRAKLAEALGDAETKTACLEKAFREFSSLHKVKGLTFDTVIMPQLTERNFYRLDSEQIERLLFVGITRATKWVYMSTSARGPLASLAAILPLEAERCLTIQRPDVSVTGQPSLPFGVSSETQVRPPDDLPDIETSPEDDLTDIL